MSTSCFFVLIDRKERMEMDEVERYQYLKLHLRVSRSRVSFG